jgi:RNA polymerase sigma-70 factor (ECF subfamily)
VTSAFLMPTTSPSRIAARFWLGLVFAEHVDHFAMHTDQGAEAIDRAGEAISILDIRDVRQAIGGDERAFERIVRRHQQEIARRLRRFSRDPLVLEELVQETFVQAFFSLHRYRSDAPLIHWLHRIAVRAGYRFWKVQRSRPINVAIEAQALLAPEPHDNDADAIDRVMARLSPRDRLVLTLMYLEDHSVDETATLTGWSRTMVKVQAYRARGRLQKLMQQERAREQV